jgi:hypothetical protein
MQKTLLFIALIIGFYPFILRGQNSNEPHCGFNELWAKTDILRLKNIYQWDENLKRALDKNTPHVNSRGGLITIPVVVHIVWNTPEENVSDAVVYAQIDILNKDFNAKNSDLEKVPNAFKKLIATQGISFCLANKDSNGLPTTGIVRTKTSVKNIGLTDKIFDTKLGGSNNWNPDKYLNIWVAATSDYITGIGSHPNLVPPNKSGVIVHPRYFGRNATSKFGLGRVAVHEIGHYFGLYHTWGQQNDTICATNDDVDDTPPQLQAYLGCPKYPQYSCGESSLFMNFMDYVNDPCMIMFTEGQMQRMLFTIEKYRSGLLKSETFCSDSDKKEPSNYTISPNPTEGKIKIEWSLSDNTKGGNILIFNSLGQLMLHQSIPPNMGYLQLNLTSSANGMYYLIVEMNGKNRFLHKVLLTK